MSNKKQTAVEWLWVQAYNTIPFQNIEASQIFNGLLQQAKEMDKEQMIIFAIWFNNRNNEYQSYENIVEQYYKETYEQ